MGSGNYSVGKIRDRSKITSGGVRGEADGTDSRPPMKLPRVGHPALRQPGKPIKRINRKERPARLLEGNRKQYEFISCIMYAHLFWWNIKPLSTKKGGNDAT
jgi:hypothetical protein